MRAEPHRGPPVHVHCPRGARATGRTRRARPRALQRPAGCSPLRRTFRNHHENLHTYDGKGVGYTKREGLFINQLLLLNTKELLVN